MGSALSTALPLEKALEPLCIYVIAAEVVPRGKLWEAEAPLPHWNSGKQVGH